MLIELSETTEHYFLCDFKVCVVYMMICSSKRACISLFYLFVYVIKFNLIIVMNMKMFVYWHVRFHLVFEMLSYAFAGCVRIKYCIVILCKL